MFSHGEAQIIKEHLDAQHYSDVYNSIILFRLLRSFEDEL